MDQMIAERAYLVKIGPMWIDLSKIESIALADPHFPELDAIHMDSGEDITFTPSRFQELMDKLASFGMLAS